MPMCFRNTTHGFLGMTFRNAVEAGREFQGLCGGGGLSLAGPTVPFHTSQSGVPGAPTTPTSQKLESTSTPAVKLFS